MTGDIPRPEIKTNLPMPDLSQILPDNLAYLERIERSDDEQYSFVPHEIWKASHEKILENLGLTSEKINILLEKIDKLNVQTKDPLKDIWSNSRRIESYATTLALLQKLFDENIQGRQIVEVGCNRRGLLVESLLSAEGAEMTGVDCNLGFHDSGKDEEKEGFLKKVKKMGPNFVESRWEDIEKHFESGTVDASYIHHMYPKPQEGGEFADNPGEFRKHIARAMYKITKPGGFFVIGQTEDPYFDGKYNNEYVPDRICFEEAGFKYYEIRKIPGSDIINMRIFQKPTN